MRRSQKLAFLIVIAGIGCYANAQASEVALGERSCLLTADARSVISQNHLIESSLAMKNAAIKAQSVAIAGKLCRWSEQYVYEITLLRRDGRVIHAFIDARSGEIVGTRNLD